MAEAVGFDIFLQVGTNNVTKSTSANLSINHDTPDASTKDSDFESIIAGQLSASISFEGLYDDADAASAEQFIDDLIAGTAVTIRFARADTPVTGEISYYTGSAYVAGVDLEAADNEPTTISVTLEINGALSVVKAGA
jgi:predicted secreted protein